MDKIIAFVADLASVPGKTTVTLDWTGLQILSHSVKMKSPQSTRHWEITQFLPLRSSV